MEEIRFRDVRVGKSADKLGGDWIVMAEVVEGERRRHVVIARCFDESIARSIANAIDVYNAVAPLA